MEIKDNLRINGEIWTVVDIAPAAELSEMVAVILEEEGFPVIVKTSDKFSDPLTHLGALSNLGTTYVLVPKADCEKALELIAESVTDYEGEDLERIMAEMAEEESAEENE